LHACLVQDNATLAMACCQSPVGIPESVLVEVNPLNREIPEPVLAETLPAETVLAETLLAEETVLREEVAQLKTLLAEKDREIAEKDGEIAALQPASRTPVPLPAALKDPNAGISLEFHQGSVVLKQRPEHIVFDFKSSPFKVITVGPIDEAKLGVQVGWTVKGMDGEDVDPDFQTFYSRFLARLNAFEGPYVMPLLFKKSGDPAEFRNDTGLYKAVPVSETPITCSFTHTLPPTVAHCQAGGLAYQGGIRKGWTLVRYADKLVDAHPNYEAFWADFQSVLDNVPKNPVELGEI